MQAKVNIDSLKIYELISRKMLKNTCNKLSIFRQPSWPSTGYSNITHTPATASVRPIGIAPLQVHYKSFHKS